MAAADLARAQRRRAAADEADHASSCGAGAERRPRRTSPLGGSARPAAEWTIVAVQRHLRGRAAAAARAGVGRASSCPTPAGRRTAGGGRRRRRSPVPGGPTGWPRTSARSGGGGGSSTIAAGGRIGPRRLAASDRDHLARGWRRRAPGARVATRGLAVERRRHHRRGSPQAAATIGATPATRRTDPSRPSSPTKPSPSNAPDGSCSSATSTPTAIARSSPEPTLRCAGRGQVHGDPLGRPGEPAATAPRRGRDRATRGTPRRAGRRCESRAGPGDVDLDRDRVPLRAEQGGGRDGSEHRAPPLTGTHGAPADRLEGRKRPHDVRTAYRGGVAERACRPTGDRRARLPAVRRAPLGISPRGRARSMRRARAAAATTVRRAPTSVLRRGPAAPQRAERAGHRHDRRHRRTVDLYALDRQDRPARRRAGLGRLVARLRDGEHGRSRSDPASVQKAADTIRAAQQSATAIATYAQQRCNAQIGPSIVPTTIRSAATTTDANASTATSAGAAGPSTTSAGPPSTEAQARSRRRRTITLSTSP